MVYLSCDVRNDFFINMLVKCVGQINKTIPSLFEITFPPKKMGNDTGKVRENVLQIQQADLIIFDITPDIVKTVISYNAGVMIEYGIVLDLAYPAVGSPWNNRMPEPTFHIYCDKKVSRRNLTPIFNEASITSYSTSKNGADQLEKDLMNVLQQKVKQNSNYKTQQTTVNIQTLPNLKVSGAL